MKDLVTKHGDRWWVSRMEGTQMKIFVGEYKTYEEAMIAHSVATEHAAARKRWLDKHNARLKQDIADVIAASKEKKDIDKL
jgi:hypothetical protein